MAIHKDSISLVVAIDLNFPQTRHIHRRCQSWNEVLEPFKFTLNELLPGVETLFLICMAEKGVPAFY